MVETSSRALPEKLTAIGIVSPRGGKVGTHRTVQRVMVRLGR
jgi:hypothetical protein